MSEHQGQFFPFPDRNNPKPTKEGMMQYQHILNPVRRMMTFGITHNLKSEDELIDTGDWMPELILQRLPADAQLVVTFYKWDSETITPHFNPERHEDQVFWSDASGITHMKIRDGRHHGWGAPLEALGLKVHNTTKLAKRLKEVVRISKYHTNHEPRIKWVETNPDNEKYYDGINILSRSFAKRMGLRSYHIRGNFRCLTPDGLIKGDAIVIPDYQMLNKHGKLYDIVSPDVNIKSELSTTDWHFSTFNPHHAHNQAMFDVQSASWLREWLFPREQMRTTLTKVIDEALDCLRRGEWPKWMVLPEQLAHLDDSADTLHNLESADEAYMRQYLRWQMHGMKPEHSASIMGMAANAFSSKLQARLNRKVRGVWNPKLWMPINHAFYGHIITHEVLMLAGYDIPSHDKLFYHEESASVSLPGKDFAATFEAHGTWDLDDSAKFILRKDEDGDQICVIVRSPNSDGEYSMHRIYGELPVYHTYGEIPKIKAKSAPPVIEVVQMTQNIQGMPADTHDMDEDYTKDEAMHMINVQKSNPGIGAVANAMMTYYASIGRSPENVLATMGDMVDCVQQTPYEAGFTAINAFTQELWNEITAYGEVDRFLYNTRVPQQKRQVINHYEGYFWSLFTHFRDEAARFASESKVIAFKNRSENPIEELMAMELDTKEGAAWMLQAEAEFNNGMKMFPGNSVQAKLNRTKHNREIIRRMVKALESMDINEANKLVLAMYKWACIPGGHRQPYGKGDRALFSPADPGETTVMDILIRALMAAGIATEADINKTISMGELAIQLLQIEE